MIEDILQNIVVKGEGETLEFSGSLDFDLSPVPGAALEDLNMELIEEYATSKLGLSLNELPIDSMHVEIMPGEQY